MPDTSLTTAHAVSFRRVYPDVRLTTLPLWGLGLPLARLWHGDVDDEGFIAALRRRVMPPAIDLGIPFRPHGDEFGNFTRFDCDLEIQEDPTSRSQVLPGGRHLHPKLSRFLLPRLQLPGDADRFIDTHIQDMVAWFLTADFDVPITANLTLQNLGIPPLYYEEQPTDHHITPDSIRKFVSGFAGPGRVLRTFSAALGERVRGVDPQQASAVATRLFGIPLDMRRGILVAGDQAALAVEFAYGETPVPPAVETYLSDGIPRVRAEHVKQWGGGAFAGAVWSCDLDVALNGPEYFRDWLSRQKEPVDRLH